MAELVALVARRQFLHHGRARAAGELFRVPAVEAVLLITAQQAALAPADSQTEKLAFIAAQVEELRRPAEPPPVDVTDDPDEPKRKRTYRRRDLVPED